MLGLKIETHKQVKQSPKDVMRRRQMRFYRVIKVWFRKDSKIAQ